MEFWQKLWLPARYRQLILALLAAVLLLVLAITWRSRPQPADIVVRVASKVKPYTFPDGGRKLFPAYRLVALYGTPGSPELGVLGQQSLPATLKRVKALAAQYQHLSKKHVLPTLEIITTIAAAGPTENGDYSREVSVSKLQPWVVAAKKAGVYVVLDLQPGRSDFLTQAKYYEELLKQPNVGLALDPEWRLAPGQFPLQQIGTVGIKEVNGVASWLANLAKRSRSPQKLLLLHEFRQDMIPQRAKLDTAHPELAYAVQMDGQGTQPQKADTWRSITAGPPHSVYFGWKNFYKKDSPMLTPTQTMAIKPTPQYISYQ